MKPIRVKVFVDGSNFFYYCREIGIPAFPLFNFDDFIHKIAEGRQISGKSYYIGAVRAKKSQKKAMRMMANQMRFFSYLKKHNWKISKGYLLESGGKHHEKGVDVKLALDIALGAVDNEYDVAVLISSDTDILPAITQAQLRGKTVEYVGFAHRPSHAMLASCDTRKLLTKDLLSKLCVADGSA